MLLLRQNIYALKYTKFILVFKEEGKMKMKKILAILLILVMVFSMAACGGGEEEAGGNVQGVTDTEILVYNSSAVSGAFASTGYPINEGIKAYFEMVNSNGGIDGRQITFLHTDDEYDPVKGKAAFEEYVYDEGVFAIVGMFGSGVTQACIDGIKEVGIPAVYFATGIEDIYSDNADTNENGRSVFPVQPIYLTEGKIMAADAVAYFGAKSIGVIYTSDDTGMDIVKGIEEQAGELGVEVFAEQVPAITDDVSAAVTSILTKNPDFVVIAAAQATFPTIAKELAAQGNTAPAITTYINGVYSMCEQVYDYINEQYDLYGTAWLDYTNEEEFQAWQEAAAWLGEEFALNGYAHCGWIAAKVFCEGLERLEGQEITWDSYIEALEAEPIKNPFGGYLDYSDGMRAGTTSMYVIKANINAATGTGWETYQGMTSLEEVLSQIN